MQRGEYSKRAGIAFGNLICIIALLSGCTLNAGSDSDSVIITATFSQPPTLAAVIQTIPATNPPVLIIDPTASPTIEPTRAPSATITPPPTDLATAAATDTLTPPVTPTITRTITNTTAAQTLNQEEIDATVVSRIEATNAALTATTDALPTATLTATTISTATLTPPSLTPPPTAIPPTRTRPSPPTVIPFDDGSGDIIPGTGNTTTTGFSPVPGLETLPHTLYYLSDAGNVNQVWRLQIGLSYPEQLTYSATGVRAFDVAPDGTLAYISGEGGMVIGGLPFLPPANPDGSIPHVWALSWSPDGNWLAYTLYTRSNNADDVNDGLWLRDFRGTTSLFVGEHSDANSAWTIYGEISWKPDSSELLVDIGTNGGHASARVIIGSRTVIPFWDAETLPFDSYRTAHWNAAGNAIITSGPNHILKVDPTTFNTTIVFTPPNGLVVWDAQESTTGTYAFVGGIVGEDGDFVYEQVYMILPNAPEPQIITSSIFEVYGFPDYLWDDTGSVNFVASYLVPIHNAPLPTGFGYFQDESGNWVDLTPLTGLVGAPQWGPTFKTGDQARVNIEDDPLNVRATPGGEWVASLSEGVLVTIIGGPREQDGYQWWNIRTANGVTGWSVEAITEDDGSQLQTLQPVAK